MWDIKIKQNIVGIKVKYKKKDKLEKSLKTLQYIIDVLMELSEELNQFPIKFDDLADKIKRHVRNVKKYIRILEIHGFIIKSYDSDRLCITLIKYSKNIESIICPIDHLVAKIKSLIEEETLKFNDTTELL